MPQRSDTTTILKANTQLFFAIGFFFFIRFQVIRYLLSYPKNFIIGIGRLKP